MTDYSHTQSRVLQWLGIILIMAVFGGAYWYFQVYAGYKTNVSPTGALTSGLVNYWTFDGADVSGTTATDRGSGGNNGTLTNGPTVTQGKVGQALDFDGTNDYVDAGDTIYSDAFTVCAWVKADVIDANSRNILLKRNSSGASAGFNEWALNASTSGFIFTTWTSASTTALNITGSTVPSINTWYHVCGVEQGNGLTGYIYMNGIQNGSATQTAALWNTADRVQVGVRSADNDNRYWNGQIDEVRIYNRALSATEVQSLYKLGASDPINSGTSQAQGGSRLDSGLAGYWPLDNGSGTSATDLSTNGNTGTLTNGPTWTTGQIGGAVDFDGTDDYIDAGTSTALVPSQISIGMWINPDTYPGSGDYAEPIRKEDSYFVSFDNATSTLYVGIKISFGSVTKQVQIPQASFPLSTWTHLTMTADGSYVRAYVNGVQYGTPVSYSGNIDNTSANHVFIGTYGTTARSNSRDFDGKLDEVRIYNRALSADEVADLYRLTTPTAVDTGLKGYWSFNGKDVSGTTAYDRSGAGNTGTLTNGPAVIPGKVGQALSFDGTNDQVNTSTIPFSSTFTVSAWGKYAGTAGDDKYYNLVTKGGVFETSSNYALGVRTQSPTAGKIHCYWRNSAGGLGGAESNSTTFGTFPYKDVWHLYTCSWDGSLVRFYLDGVLIDSAVTNAGNLPADGSQSVIIGNSNTNTSTDTRWNGSIDEARVYNRVLTDAEVKAQYAAGQSDEVNTGTSQAQGGSRLDSGLAGYWPMDNGSGTSATDLSTNGNTGTLTNGPTWTTGQVGGAVNFDGSDDYVDIGRSSISSTGALTLSVWIKPTASVDGMPIFGNVNGQAGSDGQRMIFDNSGSMHIDGVGGATGLPSSGISTLNIWYHIVDVFDGTTERLYFNGVLLGSATVTLTAASETNVFLGRADYCCSSGYFTGAMDEARVYNRALSADEVSQLYRLGSPTGTETSLKGYWSFNGKDVSGTTAYDRSGAGNTGTTSGSPVVAPGKIGQGIVLDGSDDYVSIADANSIDYDYNQDFSFSLWIKLPTTQADTSAGDNFILEKWSGSGGYSYVLRAYNQTYGTVGDRGKVYFRRYDGTNNPIVVSTSAINDNAWHHVVGTKSGSTLRIYVDGASQATATDTTTTTTTNTSPLYIGTRGGSTNNLTGVVDEVRLYNRVLTAAEVASLYNTGK